MKKFFTLLMLSILTVMNVNAAEHVLWTGSYAVETETLLLSDHCFRGNLS